MKITKYGHCCLLVEDNGVVILTDPGNYNELPVVIPTIDALLITHEHADHCHVESLKKIIEVNSAVRIITHESVGKILEKETIPHELIREGESIEVKGVTIESFGTEHACIHVDLPKVQNTGFFINKKLFYPGDSFYNPHRNIEVLALPVSGPWMKLSEAIEYAKEIKPKVVFPVHDGMLRQEHQLGPTRRIPQMILEPLGIKYVDMKEGSEVDF
jgi:L-ascorbate metabolism protein UlaG (beta-lactamase superfamily)